jgi:hypothetical protein
MAAVVTAALMTLASAAAWGGLGWMVGSVPPTRPFALVVAYLFLFTAVTSSAAVVGWIVLRPRLASGRLQTPAGFLGHAMLLASIVVFAVWLQSLRMLTPAVAALLLGVYACLELALLFGTRGSVELNVEARTTAES